MLSNALSIIRSGGNLRLGGEPSSQEPSRLGGNTSNLNQQVYHRRLLRQGGLTGCCLRVPPLTTMCHRGERAVINPGSPQRHSAFPPCEESVRGLLPTDLPIDVTSRS